jgi:hypothetical protein
MRPILFLSLGLTLGILGCQPSSATPQAIAAPTQSSIGSFGDPFWQKTWPILPQKQWGMENTSIIPDPMKRFNGILRVKYPAGSASPAVTRQGASSGGAQFLSTLGQLPQDRLRLRYFLRFSDGFNFVKGGKLPGFYGGDANSGGNTPNGSDGFSSRLMWRSNGAGEVYAYMPSSETYGTSIGRGSWTFRPGVWHQIEQELQLNSPTRSDGWVRIWLDQTLVLEQTGLRFRSDPKLKIDGLFFSTFFGGDDRSWATPKNVHIDFADFAIVPNSTK